MTDVNWLLRWSAVMETHGGHVHVPTFSSALLWSETIGCWRVNTFAICSRSARTLFSWRWLAVKEWDLSLLNYSHHQLSNKNSVCDSDYYELRLCNTCLNVWVKSDESAQSLFFLVCSWVYLYWKSKLIHANFGLEMIWQWKGNSEYLQRHHWYCQKCAVVIKQPSNQPISQPTKQTDTGENITSLADVIIRITNCCANRLTYLLDEWVNLIGCWRQCDTV